MTNMELIAELSDICKRQAAVILAQRYVLEQFGAQVEEEEALWCVKFVARNKKQDEAISAIRSEQTLICYGVLACLKGLKEQGCNGPVTEALEKMEKHLNKAAHGED